MHHDPYRTALISASLRRSAANLTEAACAAGSASTGSSGAGACRFASGWLCASRPDAMYGVTSAISHCATLSALK